MEFDSGEERRGRRSQNFSLKKEVFNVEEIEKKEQRVYLD
jgi:hypothetical protein